jgi:hypothetical protein
MILCIREEFVDPGLKKGDRSKERSDHRRVVPFSRAVPKLFGVFDCLRLLCVTSCPYEVAD